MFLGQGTGSCLPLHSNRSNFDNTMQAFGNWIPVAVIMKMEYFVIHCLSSAVQLEGSPLCQTFSTGDKPIVCSIHQFHKVLQVI